MLRFRRLNWRCMYVDHGSSPRHPVCPRARVTAAAPLGWMKPKRRRDTALPFPSAIENILLTTIEMPRPLLIIKTSRTLISTFCLGSLTLKKNEIQYIFSYLNKINIYFASLLLLVPFMYMQRFYIVPPNQIKSLKPYKIKDIFLYISISLLVWLFKKCKCKME